MCDLAKSRRRISFRVGVWAVLILGAASPAQADSGADAYRWRCAGCHAIDQNKYGPRHRGVFGRRAGTQPGYAYSRALAGSGLIWTSETLDRWLSDPKALAPGTRMDARVKDPAQRSLIIGYLKSLG